MDSIWILVTDDGKTKEIYDTKEWALRMLKTHEKYEKKLKNPRTWRLVEYGPKEDR